MRGGANRQALRGHAATSNNAQTLGLSALGGGGNRTRVLERPSGASTSVACGESHLGAPTGGGPLGQPGFDVRWRPPGEAASVSLRMTPDPRLQALRGGRLPN